MAPKPTSSNSAAASCIWVAGKFSNCVVQIPTDPSCIDDCANAQLLCRREQYPYAGSSIGDPERPYATSFGRTDNRSRVSNQPRAEEMDADTIWRCADFSLVRWDGIKSRLAESPTASSRRSALHPFRRSVGLRGKQ